MSFLGSLLSDITGGTPGPASRNPPQPPKLGRHGSSSSGTATPPPSSINPLKRKADNVLPSQAAPKALKPEPPDASSLGPTKPFSPAGKAPPNARTATASPAAKPAVNRTGTSNALTKTPLASAPVAVGPPAGPSAAAASGTPPPPLKKGSFKELMARGKLAHEARKNIVGIKHKETVKLTKQERLRLLAQDKAHRQGQRAKPGVVSKASTPSSQPGGATLKNGKTAAPPAQYKKKERPPLGYKGTMRQDPTKQSKPSSAAAPSSTKRSKSMEEDDDEGVDEDDGYATRYRYAGSSEEEDEYESDESEGKFGGGYDELEAEEEASLAAAKKEDLRALREEEKHRSEKLAKKQKLEELRKARAAKGL